MLRILFLSFIFIMSISQCYASQLPLIYNDSDSFIKFSDNVVNRSGHDYWLCPDSLKNDCLTFYEGSNNPFTVRISSGYGHTVWAVRLDSGAVPNEFVNYVLTGAGMTPDEIDSLYNNLETDFSENGSTVMQYSAQCSAVGHKIILQVWRNSSGTWYQFYGSVEDRPPYLTDEKGNIIRYLTPWEHYYYYETRTYTF